jgi:kynurenine formamidase
LIGECRVIRTQNTSVAVGDILCHEEQHGVIPSGSIVVCHTGWSSRYYDGP